MVTAVKLFSLWWHCDSTVVIVVALWLYSDPCGDIVVTGGDIVVTVVVLRSCRDTVLIVVALWWHCVGTVLALWWHCGGTVITLVTLWSLRQYCGDCGATVIPVVVL